MKIFLTMFLKPQFSRCDQINHREELRFIQLSIANILSIYVTQEQNMKEHFPPNFLREYLESLCSVPSYFK